MLSDTHGPLTHSSQAQVDALGFDVLFLSDLLHFDTSHDVLALSIASLLTRNAEARVYVSVGAYTKPNVIKSFFELFSTKATRSSHMQQNIRKAYPIIWEEVQTDSMWRGETRISGVGDGELGIRKGSCRLWVGKWCVCV